MRAAKNNLLYSTHLLQLTLMEQSLRVRRAKKKSKSIGSCRFIEESGSVYDREVLFAHVR